MSKPYDSLVRKNQSQFKGSVSSGAGAVDEIVFQQSFVPSNSTIASSSRELADQLGRVRDALSGNQEEWERRVESMKTLRSLVANGAAQFDDFLMLLRGLESPIDTCVKDLRSTVVREACITIAYLAEQLGQKFDRCAECVLPSLLLLLPNSAKIMASSGLVALRFVIQNTYSVRLLPMLLNAMASKSNVIRKHGCEFLEVILREWPMYILEKHSAPLYESIKRSLSDADPDARTSTRRAFPFYASKFPDKAGALLLTLDASKRKLIEKDLASAGLDTLLPSSSSTTSSNDLLTKSATNGTSQKPRSANTVSRVGKLLQSGSIAGTTIQSRPPLTSHNGRGFRTGRGGPGTVGRKPGQRMVTQSQLPYLSGTPSIGLRFIPDGDGFDTVKEQQQYCDVNGDGDQQASTSSNYSLNLSAPTPPRSESSATSREVSPSRLPFNLVASELNNRPGLQRSKLATTTGGYTYVRSRNYRPPLSQGASREGSPTRVNGRFGRDDPGAFYTPRASLGSEYSNAGDNFSSYRNNNESDDNISETSSQHSEMSSRSITSGIRRPNERVTNNLKEIMELLTGAQWFERTDGLKNLSNLLRSGYALNFDEVRRLTDVFSNLLVDAKAQVVYKSMETLQIFIKQQCHALTDWLYVLLSRLLLRQGQAALGSHQAVIKDTLFVVRSYFPLNLQFATCCHFIMDNSQTPNFKVKVCLLDHMKDLILMMTPDVIGSPTPEMGSAIARIISWCAEPKSADLRRVACRVVFKLYDLNPTSFAFILRGQPQKIQTRAQEVLASLQKANNYGGGGGPIIDEAPSTYRRKSLFTRSASVRLPSSPTSPSSTSMFNSRRPDFVRSVHADSMPVSPMATDLGMHTSNFRSRSGRATPDRRQSDGAAQVSGIPMPRTSLVRGQQAEMNYASPPPLSDHYAANTNNTLVDDTMQNFAQMKLGHLGTIDQSDEDPPEDFMSEILQELSNHNERHEQRKTCMLKLIKMFRDGAVNNWDEYFKPTLLILLETLGDNGISTRALALRVLQELVRAKPDLFYDFACLFVIKVLESCRDEDKSVICAAEECSTIIAQHLPPELCYNVLTPLIKDPKFLFNLPAVKMQRQVVVNSSPELIKSMLHELTPGLIVGCNDEDSAMRKACVFCLVEMYNKIGDDLWNQLTDLNTSKKRLIKVYIERQKSTSTSEASLGVET